MITSLIDPPPTRFARHAGLARLPYFDLAQPGPGEGPSKQGLA